MDENSTCDVVCGDVGGTNLAERAETAFPDSCSGPGAGDVSTWFATHGDPAGWGSSPGGATGGHTLGYGYRNGVGYYGKCSTGTSLVGTYPGEANPGTGLLRTPVCACARASALDTATVDTDVIDTDLPVDTDPPIDTAPPIDTDPPADTASPIDTDPPLDTQVPVDSGLPTVSSCPPANSPAAIGGPASLYGFCWYITEPFGTCDLTCAALGGANLSWQAESTFPDSCSAASAADVTTWFVTQGGDPAGWGATVSGGTSGHTLGYGYAGVGRYGKCSTGTAAVGTYPGEANPSPPSLLRSPVCPCFVDAPDSGL